MLSAEFQRFISQAGRVIERALAESVDIYTDYIGGADSENAQYVVLYFLHYLKRFADSRLATLSNIKSFPKR